MNKPIAGLIEPKSRPLSPIYTYEVDIGKGKPLLIEANRVDQIGTSLTFLIEYTDYNIHVAGFSQWKSYRLLKIKEAPPSKPPAKDLPKGKEKKNSQYQLTI